jgi:uncharacterized protein
MAETSVRRHVVIFARYPMLGGGKRRLAAGIGAVGAVHFQRVVLRHLLARISTDRRWTTWIAATPDGSGPWPGHVGVVAQGRGDLGQRLQRVVRALPGGELLIIGTDIPGIGAPQLANAFDMLGGHDGVFGPASDGGFWLVGLSARGRRLRPFDDVRWSSEHALADTQRAFAPGRVALTVTLDDVDDVATLNATPKWSRLIQGGA